jgi:ArsR family transcriptional regulator, arsenate/arsenite/antimonite-responsive transcriptional repressor
MEDDQNYLRFAENFGKGISNAIRFKILILLSKNPMTVSELVEKTGALQSTVSQHLLVLKNGQLITSEKKGQYVYYALNFDYLITGLKGITTLLEKNASKERKE